MFKNVVGIVNYDDIISFDNLMNAFIKAKRKNNMAGSDGISPRNIIDSEKFVNDLKNELESGNYRPKKIIKQCTMKYDETCMIEFDVLCFSDRVIQYAIKNQLLPLINNLLLDYVCGYRGKVYKKRYFQYIDYFWNNNYKYIVSFDVQQFFKSIDKKKLMTQLNKYCDILTGNLIEKQLFRDSDEYPLGHVLSPLLSNLYLINVDYEIYNKIGIFIRYGDNYIFPIKDNLELKNKIECELEVILKNVNLKLNKNKVFIFSEYKDIGIL